MNFKAFYGLSCNPFDKHSLKISDSFESADQRSMMNRLPYLKAVSYTHLTLPTKA